MKKSSSRALEVNLQEYRVAVTIDPRYYVIQEVLSRYDGLKSPVATFLEELCHPRRNWQFIINEARTFSLGYFYDLKSHAKGEEAARLYIDIAVEGMEEARDKAVRADAFHNLYLLLQKIIRESGPGPAGMHSVVLYGFEQMTRLSDEALPVMATGFYQIKKLAELFVADAPEDCDLSPVAMALSRYYDYTFSYWLSEKDPLEWFRSEVTGDITDRVSSFFEPVTHASLKQNQAELNRLLRSDGHSGHTISTLLALPGFGEIVSVYRNLPESLYKAIDDEQLRHECKIILLFHSMHVPGLSSIREETLREINSMIAWLIDHEDTGYIEEMIDQTFSILSRNMDEYPDAVLKSILNMGSGIYQTDESDLVQYFNSYVVRAGFQTPEFSGITDDWQIRSNLAHIQNIRTWMELITCNPRWSRQLLSALIINLSLSGVLIKDTDLFPRDITKFLNADIEPVYTLSKQLLRLFPSYFNEIGAEGQLRDISTRLDEACKRQDRLIHFLRKQSHVESSNKIISLIEATFEFWKTTRKKALQQFLPPDIYGSIDEAGPYIDGMHKVLAHLFSAKQLGAISDLLSLEDDYMTGMLEVFPEENRTDIERTGLAISLYKLLNEKYCLSSTDIDSYIAQVQSSIPLNLKGLNEHLAGGAPYQRITGLLEYLEQLKQIILSQKEYEVREDIYRKRHIAADIPSMYGSYREAKFDALGLTFRLEARVNTLFEELIEELDLTFITRQTLYHIYTYLSLFQRALRIDGIPTGEFEQQIDLLKRSLKIRLFTFTQYLDIFQSILQVVQNIVRDNFDTVHRHNLMEISRYLPVENLLPKYSPASDTREELFQKVAEIFMRDSIASSLGLQKLDLFLSRISDTLHRQAEKLPVDKHYLLLTYNPRNVVSSVTRPLSHLLDSVHLGNKGLNLTRMKSLGMQVPPGFIITTEVYRCRVLIESYGPARENFRNQVAEQVALLEEQTGKRFGSPDDTLLVSVRSGSTISQPGMMDSYLNVGMNEKIVQGMARQTGQPWFAWDSYRRFLQSYGMSYGIDRDSFDAVIDTYKRKFRAPLKKDFTPDQMKEVALGYREHIVSSSVPIEESPWEQLYIAISRVLNSWNSDKARTYRKIIGISDDWGTAVTVQVMVFGNLSHQSGSGVLFTHSPRFSAGSMKPWGDYTIGNQGEDVVSGLVSTYPVSVFQAQMESRTESMALERKFPAIYRALTRYAGQMIDDNQWSPQDIEFTFESPDSRDLYLLQTRNMEMKESTACPAFEDTAEMTDHLLGHGIGVSGGALSGQAVFCLDDIERFRSVDPATPLILVRGDTVPDDIKEISASDGLLTARGGATSHASIVANRLGKTCVVGCRDLVCLEQERRLTLGGREVRSGEFISIDGSSGSIYYGKLKTGKKGE